ncbi:MAG: aldehyde dehydrogenase family protein [Firmicutes bacterium]|nr:aldehyde dehydrogenase family protein [Bacillota bacterium]
MSYIIGSYENYIKGVWQKPKSGEYKEQLSTIDGTAVSKCAMSNLEDVSEAVAVAKIAFETEDWSNNPRKRSKALLAWAAKLKERISELATELSWQVGKPYKEAFGEMMGAIGYLEYYAGAARTLYGSTTSIDENTLSVMCREPVGVIGVIVPWNYPITLLMRDMAPALAAGNTCIVKPAEQTSGITMKVISLLEGIPEFPVGVVNAITGKGSLIGNALVKHKDVDMIDFTGSVDVGKEIMQQAADTMKKLSLELGGKSASIIFADADMEKALPYALKSIFSNAGQLCTSASRILVEESISEEFLSRLKTMTEALVVGNPLDQSTEMGAMNTPVQMETVLAYIEEGKKQGQLLTGGYRVTENGLGKGYFVAPTIFVNLPFDSALVQEEIFGPVLCVQTFKTEEEAIFYANGTCFGLASGVWSQNIDRAMRVSKKMRAGTTWVNCYNRLMPECETGGYKQSGIDRAGGIEGINKFTEVKHLCIDFAPAI